MKEAQPTQEQEFAREPHSGWLNAWMFENVQRNPNVGYMWQPENLKMAGDWADFRTAALRAELEQARQELKEANRVSDAFRTKWEEITREVNRLGDERSEERRKSTWEYIRRHYGKVEDWARKELPEPWRTQFFCCLANGTSGVLSSDYFKDSAAEQMFYDQCKRAEAAESREKRVREALERTVGCLFASIRSNKPVRDADEVIVAARRALEGE